MKKPKQALSNETRDSDGDIFKQLIISEDIVKIKEHLFEEAPIVANRAILSRAHAEYTKYFHFAEEFGGEKSGIQWFTEGYKHTIFFHNLVKGRRKRLDTFLHFLSGRR